MTTLLSIDAFAAAALTGILQNDNLLHSLVGEAHAEGYEAGGSVGDTEFSDVVRRTVAAEAFKLAQAMVSESDARFCRGSQ